MGSTWEGGGVGVVECIYLFGHLILSTNTIPHKRELFGDHLEPSLARNDLQKQSLARKNRPDSEHWHARENRFLTSVARVYAFALKCFKITVDM